MTELNDLKLNDKVVVTQGIHEGRKFTINKIDLDKSEVFLNTKGGVCGPIGPIKIESIKKIN